MFERPMQFSSGPPQFNLSKSFDTFGPISSVLPAVDSLDNPSQSNLNCSVNNELRQQNSTADLIFDIPYFITCLSEIVTLNLGYLIFACIPAGINVVEEIFLRDGDIVTTSIEGLGTLRKRCVRVGDHSRANIVPDTLTDELGYLG